MCAQAPTLALTLDAPNPPTLNAPPNTPLPTRFCFPSHSLAPFLHRLHPQTRTHPLPRTPLHPKDPHTPPESLVRPLATRYERADRISFATITPSASGPLGTF